MRCGLDALLRTRCLAWILAGTIVLAGCDAQPPANAPIATQVVVSIGTVAAVPLGVGLRYEAISVPFAAAGIGLAIVAARRYGSAPCAATAAVRRSRQPRLLHRPLVADESRGRDRRRHGQRVDRTARRRDAGAARQHGGRMADPPLAAGQLAVLRTATTDRSHRVAIPGLVLADHRTRDGAGSGCCGSLSARPRAMHHRCADPRPCRRRPLVHAEPTGLTRSRNTIVTFG